jgi:2'-5' RNA ligase
VLLAPTVPPELTRLVASLHAVLLDAGVIVDERMFRPHITIVKRARHFETERLAQPVVLEWDDFALIESVAGHGGPSYHPLKQ